MHTQGPTGAWTGAPNSAFADQNQPRPTTAVNGTAAKAPSQGGLMSVFSRKDTDRPDAAAGGGRVPLDKREQELARREAAVARREQELARAQTQFRDRLKDWPSCYPVLRHNIGEDIPAWNRGMVRWAYLTWLLSLLGFTYNWLIILLATAANTGQAGLRWWFLATVIWFTGVPGSFFLWYRSLYYAAKTDGSTWSYMKSLLFVVVHLAWSVWMILAIPGLGDFSAGVFPMLSLFNDGGGKGVAFGIMYIINIGIWGCVAFLCTVISGYAIKAYRAGDAPRKAHEAIHGPGTA